MPVALYAGQKPNIRSALMRKTSPEIKAQKLARLVAREWVVSAHRARLQRQYSDLAHGEINLKVLGEIERAEPKSLIARD